MAGSEVVGVLGPDSLVVEHPIMRAAMLELNTTLLYAVSSIKTVSKERLSRRRKRD